MVICVSESAQQDLLEIYGVEKARTRLVHHGVTPVAETAGAFRDGDPRPYVLYVGSRSAYKNFFALVEAFEATDNARSMRLVVAGGGGWGGTGRTGMAEQGLGG